MLKKNREKISYLSSAAIVDKTHFLAKNKSFKPYRCVHEKFYAERLESLGIKFLYESEAFEVEIDGILLHWIPDFYLQEEDRFVEIDCSSSSLKKKKVKAFKEQYPYIKLEVLKR